MNSTKEVVNIGLHKEGLEVGIMLKVAPEIEDFFKTAANGQTEQSNKWQDENGNGLHFYKKAETLSRKVGDEQVMDNFGNGLFDAQTDRINVALIRTVGASSGIKIKTTGLMSYAEMEVYIRDLAEWIKAFYEMQLKPAEIKGIISLEV